MAGSRRLQVIRTMPWFGMVPMVGSSAYRAVRSRLPKLNWFSIVFVTLRGATSRGSERLRTTNRRLIRRDTSSRQALPGRASQGKHKHLEQFVKNYSEISIAPFMEVLFQVCSAKVARPAVADRTTMNLMAQKTVRQDLWREEDRREASIRNG